MDEPLNQRSRTDLRQLRLLGVIIGLSETSANGAVLDVQLVEHPDVDYGLAEIRDELRALGQKNQVMIDARLTGPVYATPRGLGIAEWSAFEALRSSSINRRVELRDDYLRWLYEATEEDNGHPTRDDFQRSGRTYFGLAYTTDDVSKASAWLKEEGFIEGQGSWGSPAPLYPALTSKGRSAVENGRTVSNGDQDERTATTYNTTVHGSAIVAQGNRDVRQMMTVELVWQEKSRDVADAIEQAVPLLAVDVREEVNAHLGELRAALAERPAPGAVRRTLTSLGESLGNASTGALGKMLVEKVAETLGLLPS